MAGGEASKKSDKMNTTSFDDLPAENAVEILLKLPVKSLIRSSLVNKTWYSLIVNPNFISQQLKHAISSHGYENAVLIVHYDPVIEKENCLLVSAETGYVFDRFEYLFNNWSGILRLVGSVDGILCLSDCLDNIFAARQNFYLWNPSIRKFRFVVSSSLKNLFNERRKCYFQVVGFGFHQPTHDYRIVRVVYASVRDTKSYVPRAEVFSLRTNNWREIQDPGVPRVVASNFGTTVDNCVYWAERQDAYKFAQMWIMSFDFNNEVFGQVKLPDDVRFCLGDIASFELMKFEGLLAVCVSNWITASNGMPSQSCCIWLMREENGIVSWTIRFKVALKEQVRPFDITRSGTLLMWSLSRCGSVLLSCNLKNKQDLQLGELLVGPACNVDTSFIDSLLLLEGREELLKSTK